ncbi:MAG: hypothetical protein BGP04_17930 [Rhizobiales bacterium 62-17]|nr:hypothetical protein [Hyphomicrobiales bacterium]OJX99580.1 MAG: hypothetical protein BGP04_17930 [Rhizobiales bacterium 62-17]
MDPHVSHELFPHVRIVLGMVIGLGITRILAGVAGFIQHPGRYKLSVLHMLWVLSILIELVLFWWWEFGLSRIDRWTFGIFIFVIGYAVVLYLLAALLFPDNIAEYGGYEDFFLKRRRWFFAILATTFVFDVIDTLIKGLDYFNRLNLDYLVQVPIGLALCLVGWISVKRNVQIGLALAHMTYQAYWIARVYNTMH